MLGLCKGLATVCPFVYGVFCSSMFAFESLCRRRPKTTKNMQGSGINPTTKTAKIINVVQRVITEPNKYLSL